MATTVKIIIKRRERKRKDAYAILRSTSHHRVECFCTLPWVSLTCVITLRYIYICVCVYFFFLFSCYKSPWRNIFASPLLLAFQQIVIVNRLIVALIGVNTCVHTRDSLSFFFLHLCSFSFFLLFFYKKAFKLKEHLGYVFAKAYSANFSTILS